MTSEWEKGPCALVMGRCRKLRVETHSAPGCFSRRQSPFRPPCRGPQFDPQLPYLPKETFLDSRLGRLHQAGNLLPFVTRISERKHRASPVTKTSNDPLIIDAGLDFSRPVSFGRQRRHFRWTANQFEALQLVRLAMKYSPKGHEQKPCEIPRTKGYARPVEIGGNLRNGDLH